MLKARNAHHRRDVSSFVPENNSGHNYVNSTEKTLFNLHKNRLQKSFDACTKPPQTSTKLDNYSWSLKYFANKK